MDNYPSNPNAGPDFSGVSAPPPEEKLKWRLPGRGRFWWLSVTAAFVVLFVFSVWWLARPPQEPGGLSELDKLAQELTSAERDDLAIKMAADPSVPPLSAAEREELLEKMAPSAAVAVTEEEKTDLMKKMNPSR